MTIHMVLEYKVKAAYKAWRDCRRIGIISTVRWLKYKYWQSRLSNLPISEAEKEIAGVSPAKE
jgi:hypothetical protein